jgi:D-2-hydroxyacid dehydrogenase (NADP+)
MLSHAKRLPQRFEHQRRHLWTRLDNDELAGRTVLIVGLGRIGQAVARLCKAFGMRVTGVRRSGEPAPDVDEVFGVSALSRRLPEADYVVLALPLTPATENLLDASAFRSMKASAYLINVGRGRVVCEADMLRALREGWIAGAYLDVFATEPLPDEHPLWEMPNVTIVPHDSHSSPYVGDRLVSLFCENLRRYVAKEPLQNVCDVRRGY